MKRDFDLIRLILLQVEAAPAGLPQQKLDLPEGVDPATAMEHLKIMIEEGLIDGQIASARQHAFAIRGLTWKGHDFLDAARSDTIWAKGKEQLAKVGGSSSLEIIKAVLSQLVKAQLGLP